MYLKEDITVKKNQKFLAVLLILAMCLSMFTACGGNKTKETSNNAEPTVEATTPTEEATPTATEEPAVDLGGMEIVIGDWWSSADPAAPTTAQEEATQAYREEIQAKYNFTIKQVAVAEWGTMQETFTTSTMAEDPAAQVFILAPDWVAQPLANGLVYDLATLENLDFTESKWNPSVLKTLTYGDSVYGMAAGKPEPKLGVYWNKRLFEEAGLDPNLPYDLQASGEWTWSKFEELCKSLTIDSNNDGTIDSYAMASFSADLFKGAITSNDARYIDKDDSGMFINGSKDPKFLEALQWAVSLIQKNYEMPAPADANWDWFISAFHDAKVAMQFAEVYKTGTWADMEDDWGFVLCPKGPKANGYEVYFNDNVAVIPSSYDKETAEKIAFAYNLWTNPTPGYEDDSESWKDGYYTRFRDERAVDETLTMMYDSATINTDYASFVYGLDLGTIIWDTYALGSTPAEKIEQVADSWQALIDDANKK
jgi:hypothetical protein